MSKDAGICPQDGCNQLSKHILKIKGKFRGDKQGENREHSCFLFFSSSDVGRVEALILVPWGFFFFFIAEMPPSVVAFVGKLVNWGERRVFLSSQVKGRRQLGFSS